MVAAALVAVSAAAGAALRAQSFTALAETMTPGATGTVTVPAGVCFVRVQIAGGAGGTGYQSGFGLAPFDGGTGAFIEARVAVTPGAQLFYGVGGAGGDGSEGAGGAGGVGGGGSGGMYTDFRGGGGGGASIVALNGAPVVVAGGGGGGFATGGAAGSANGNGQPGDTFLNSEFPEDLYPAGGGLADGGGGQGGVHTTLATASGGGGGGVTDGGGATIGGGSGGDGDGTYGGGGGGGGGAMLAHGGAGANGLAPNGGPGGTAGGFGAAGGNGALGIGGGGGAAGTGGGGGAGYGGGGGAGGVGGGGGGSSFVVSGATDVASDTNTGDGFVSVVYDPVADACARPAFTKAFAPAAIETGETSTLTFTIDGSATTLAATALAFTDVLPAGVEIAATPNASTTCTGGTLTAVAGTNTIGYAGGSLAAGASCTVSVDVTSDTADAHVNTSGDLTSSLGNSGVATATLTVAEAAFTVPAATGGGTITGTISGGGPTCTIDSAVATTAEAVAGGGPSGVTLPHGLVDFRIDACTPGSAVTFTVTFPEPLAPGTVYWKYGPTADDPTPHWYTIPATIVGATVTYTITDGGLGDDDLTANGTIEDPAGPGPAMAVPTVPVIVMGVLTLLLVGIGVVTLRRRMVLAQADA